MSESTGVVAKLEEGSEPHGHKFFWSEVLFVVDNALISFPCRGDGALNVSGESIRASKVLLHHGLLGGQELQPPALEAEGVKL